MASATATEVRPARRRTRRPRAEREAEILSAARHSFAEHGYGATAVSEIAARAGVVEGTIYTYFESKRTLLIAVMKQFYEELIADTRGGSVRRPGHGEPHSASSIRRHVDLLTVRPRDVPHRDP